MEEQHEHRRADRRLALQVPITLLPVGSGPTMTGITRDVSIGGVFFYAPAEFSVGSKVVFELTLPAEILNGKAMPVRGKGEVLRVAVNPEGQTGVAVRVDSYQPLQ